jgi:hypothetical protein
VDVLIIGAGVYKYSVTWIRCIDPGLDGGLVVRDMDNLGECVKGEE